jgi:hypothetical protein
MGYQVQWIVVFGEKVGHLYPLVSFLQMATNLLTKRVTKSNQSIGEERLGPRMWPLHDTSKVITYEMKANPIHLVA